MINYETPQGIWAGVTPCPMHTTDVPGGQDYLFVPDCKGCLNEMKQRNAVVDQMGKDGATATASLARQGFPSPDQMMLHIRIETLIDTIASDPRTRMRFEGEVGRRTIMALREAEVQIARAKLTGLATPDKRLTVVQNGDGFKNPRG